MIRPRHPDVADHMVLSLSHGRGGFHLEGAAECRDRLVAVGIDAPEWGDVDCAVPGTPDVIWEDPGLHVRAFVFQACFFARHFIPAS